MVKISKIVNKNPWWKHGEKFAIFDKNLKEANIKPIFFKKKRIDLNKGNIYVLRGPLQVGKTTYITESINKLISGGIDPNHILYLSSDFFISRSELRKAIEYFMGKNINAADLYMYIDEITSIKDWNFELKYLSDSGTLERAGILVTGSCASALRRKGELLPGRGLEGNECHMKPLSFRDFVFQTASQVISTIGEAELRDSLKELLSILEKSHKILIMPNLIRDPILSVTSRFMAINAHIFMISYSTSLVNGLSAFSNPLSNVATKTFSLTSS
ncbi:MAG: AAA family ATPase [Candidatus Bathyarchaeia archaeon]